MSWSINVVGTKAAVARRVQGTPVYGPPEQDTQVETAKSLILMEIDALPDDMNGVWVEASGHVVPGMARGRTLAVRVVPVDIVGTDVDRGAEPSPA